MSRKAKPKQLLPIIGGRSLLEIAASRLDGMVEPGHRLICTAEMYRAAIRHALPQFADEQILGEPMGRDTANAVGFTAAVLQRADANAVFAVLTADHLIEPQDEVARAFELGFRLVENDPARFVTFSITPTYPATGFGYVEHGEPMSGFAGAFRARRFVEKPDAVKAREYLASGAFNWNSGMFIFSAAMCMQAMREFLPENWQGLNTIAHNWGGPKAKAVVNEIYPTLKKISVDYGVMEPASRSPRFAICTVPMNVSWLDVGSWPSYGETLHADAHDNRANTPITLVDSHNVLAVSDDPNHTITTVDCENLIIVHTRDATLVCRRESAEKIKDLVAKVDARLQ